MKNPVNHHTYLQNRKLDGGKHRSFLGVERGFGARCLRAGAVISLGAFTLTAVAPDALADSARRIAFGEPVAECGFAPVMFVNGCTALLVHPQVVLYAAHCGTRNKETIYFTHTQGQGIGVATERCETYPDYSNPYDDWAYCLLKEPMTDIPVIPVAYGCELDNIQQGTPIVQIGFGAIRGREEGYGTKRWGENTVGSIDDRGATGRVKSSPSKTVGCPGDSGGPMLVQLEDGSWRTIGMASTIDTGYDSCGQDGAVNSYAFAKNAVAWVEERSGHDITPCFDDMGNWAPTKDCGGFFTGDETPHGTWANACMGVPRGGASSTCGDPFDDEPPAVDIVDPNADLVIEEGTTLKVVVSASDNVGVSEVNLMIGGQPVGMPLTMEPYEFDLIDLELGEHELMAVASDEAGLSAMSGVVTVTVEMPDDSTETTTGDDDDDDDDGDTGDDDDDSGDDDDDDDDSGDDDDDDDDSGDDDDDDDDSGDDDDDDDDSGDDDDDDDDSGDDDDDDDDSGDDDDDDDDDVMGETDSGEANEDSGSSGCSTSATGSPAGLSSLLLGGLLLGLRRRS